jgi:hypothetical protein
MPKKPGRACHVCNREEHILEINQRLRDGESCATIAREFNFSQDSVERHRSRHVMQIAKVTDDPATMLHLIIRQTGELASAARLTGDVRGSVDAIARQLSALTTLIEHEKQTKLESSTPPPLWINGQLNEDAPVSAMTLADFDRAVQQVIEANPNLDFSKRCPMCDQMGSPRLDLIPAQPETPAS